MQIPVKRQEEEPTNDRKKKKEAEDEEEGVGRGIDARTNGPGPMHQSLGKRKSLLEARESS